MIEQVNAAIIKHHQHGLLLDANLMLVLVIGTLRPEYVGTVPRTKAFVRDDYYLLLSLCRRFLAVVTTPHVLTEVGNLLDNTGLMNNQASVSIVRDTLRQFREKFVVSREAMNQPTFYSCGLTDSVLYYLTHRHYLLLTTDAVLCNFVLSRGCDAINFNNIRTYAWQDWQA